MKSDAVKKGLQQAPHRSLFNALGMTEEEMNNLIAAMGGEPGDLLLFAADKNKVVWDVLGNLRLELAKQMELLDKNQYNFLWVTEFPLLEWSDEQNRYLAG